MPNKEQVSSLQIAFMIMLFEIGSTPLFLLGGKAKQDSWLAMCTGSAAGFLLLLLLMWIQHRCPDKDLMGMLIFHFGKIAGTSIGGVYVIYFAYQSMRNVRDLGELTAMTLLPKTPMFVTMLVFILLALYAIWKGAEVVFRLPEVLLPVMLFFYFVLVLLLGIMGSIDFRHLAPVMGDGLMPVIKAALPDIVSFPFGQMIVFLMLWSLWEKPGVPVKYTVNAYLLISLFLIFMNALNVAVLGPTIAGISQLPFLKTVRTLSNLKFVERLDILVTVQLFLGLLVKMMLFFFCSVKAVSELTGKPARWWVFPVGAVIFSASFLERDYTQHIAVGLGPSLKLDPLFQVAIPLLLTLSILIRSRFKRPSS
ncbi:endospore germination permease [Paenibacillus sp. MMS20-IR301]|uniref:GerAB/ArcD/ProY family transporter n=1 Tax=Paenibacillus sp. MMS20-IR301 TaxID=2895946 RepID=UPI0028E85049|nr:endospore germination permease [Paenibacillus sp. MMS20-IR301]WNS41167.1 endospore germination permease [Paenibacillus sp. MMS20-IR301]